MGESKQIALEQRANALERELRNNHNPHRIARALFGTKRSDAAIEAEELPLLDIIARNPSSSLTFVNENSCEDIRKAHRIKIPGLSETYAVLENEVFIVPPVVNLDSIGAAQFQPVRVSVYPKNDANLDNAQKIVSMVASVIRYKQPH
ncbi:MAG: hypothetical protein KGH57_01430 [Candidatus Micrarchaeota archaeon]|nr:hypothetical protein [Candidatus Micrarchaeota archaeon]